MIRNSFSDYTVQELLERATELDMMAAMASTLEAKPSLAGFAARFRMMASWHDAVVRPDKRLSDAASSPTPDQSPLFAER
jgi:hypothetical protein